MIYLALFAAVLIFLLTSSALAFGRMVELIVRRSTERRSRHDRH